MKIHTQEYRVFLNTIWNKRYLQPIKESIQSIITKYKNKEDYIQDILTLREDLINCSDKFVSYNISDEYDLEFIRLIEGKVTNDVRFLFFTLINEILTDNPIEDVPNIFLLEYVIFRKIYMNENIIDKDYGLDIDEEYVVKNVISPNYTPNDMAEYLLEKHFSHIRYTITEYLEDETRPQELINSIMEYQKELIEMCPMSVDVENIDNYTHSESEISLNLLPSVAKRIIPLIEEILALPLRTSS